MSIDKSQFTIINNDIEISGSMPGVTNSKGGYKQVETIADRDAIDISYRVKGMLVYVSEDNTIYILTDPETNKYEEYVSNSVKRYNSFISLPSAGKDNIIYLTTDTYTMYAWDSNKIQYIQLNNKTDIPKINQIICGDSNG